MRRKKVNACQKAAPDRIMNKNYFHPFHNVFWYFILVLNHFFFSDGSRVITNDNRTHFSLT